MLKLVMIAREITKKEIELGIGKERSSTRLSPIFKTIDLNVPIKNKEIYIPSIPINPFEGTPLLLMPLFYVPFDESILFGTPIILDKIISQKIQPTHTILDPGKGTGSPIIAASIETDENDILILAACDQLHTPAVKKAIKTILEKMEKKGFESGTVLTTGTKNPAFSYIKVQDDKAINFMLKGTIPKDDMIAETMLVCCRVSYLKKQINKMKNTTIEELAKLYPYEKHELLNIKDTLKEISKYLNECKTASEYLEKCPFCDFSKVIHRLLIPSMTYSTVEYQKEWDDLGDWQKVYNSPFYPKDEKGNLVFSKKNLISYSNCENSVIANFTNEKIIVNNLKNRIFASGPRGTIDLPMDMDPSVFKKEVVKIQM
ncbi:MAG: hypothetical protein EAX90_15620 [Candidatus Heimdallarchaeota archaeon]|nr:hypothetical protein [Candidatus Heimdallarchaeota archaeon]